MTTQPPPSAITRNEEPWPRLSAGWAACLLCVLTILSFLRVGTCDFVNYDDPEYITANVHVQGGLTLESVTWALSTGYASNWHPLTWLSHVVDWTLFGPRPLGHHLTSLAFHTANALLLFGVLRGLTGATWRSWLVAALFAVHPLHVESVAWVSERKDVLSMFFCLLSIDAYVRYTRRPATSTYLVALLFFALGLMSKPMLVTLPFLLLLFDWWPLARWIPSADQPAQLRRLLLEKVPFLMLSAGSCIVTFLVQRSGGAVSTSLSWPERLSNALVSYCRYLVKTFWPLDLSVLYPHPGHWPAWQVISAGLVLATLSFGVVLLAKRRPHLAVGWLWFIGTLVPVIGLVQVGIQSMADRYSYLPSVGLFVMLVWTGAEFLSRLPLPRTAGAAAAGIILLACSALTWRQVGYWENSLTLFERAIKVTDRNYLAYNNIGFFLSAQGKPAEAMEYYRKSLEINPRYEDALNNLGYALAGQQRFQEAIPYYEAALRIRPNHPDVHNNLGNALSELGKADEAIQQYEIALKANPEHSDAHNNLGVALAMRGKLDEAIGHFRQAIRFKPGFASAHSNLGNAFAAKRQWQDAIAEYHESLRLNPADSQAHNNLANVYVEQGQLEQAVGHYQQALALAPSNPGTHLNLGLTLNRLGRRDEAIQQFEEVLRFKPGDELARKQLELLRRK